ncbi:MAG: O-acetyl-ADP-ribose deacetylase [Candidatus Geothermincolia bacterium]
MGGRIKVIRGDITKLAVDAIVNAANRTLLGGGGVDGAIHRAAGPQLLEATRQLGGCATGQSKLTAGYRLPARYVIHTVGPVWHGGERGEDELLESCYRTSLELAAANAIATIAFPAISTGVYRFPLERATRIALRATGEFMRASDDPREVIFCCFSERDRQAYETLALELPPAT